jgi:hypothetical protein
MKIIAGNELMKNHKAAEILPPQSAFESLQTEEGNAILLCIGDAIGENKATRKALYLVIEEPDQPTGWQATDISSGLSAKHQGSTISVQKFSVTQCRGNGEITIAMTVQMNGSSHLYLLAGLSSKSGSDWMKKDYTWNWIARPYDDAGHPISKLEIDGIYLTPQHSAGGDSHHLLICAVRDSKGYLQNYIVNFSGGNAWQPLQTAENFSTIRSQQIGKAKESLFPGLYQLTELNGGATIDITPMESMYPGAPKTIIKLTAPPGANMLVTVPVDDQNNTDLFVATDQGIYLYPSDRQDNFAEGIKIISGPLITGIRSFYVHQSSADTIIWGLNQQGQVFCSRCTIGKESDSKAWSAPIPILSGVEQITSYVNHQESNSVIFAHTSGQRLVRLTQDPQTTLWLKSDILLPATGVNSIIEYTTYTTQIQVTKDNNIPYTDARLWITSTSNCSVFINNIYYLLSPTVPIGIAADASGQISIVQETQSLGAVCYHLEAEDKSVRVDINPMAKVIADMDRKVSEGTIPGSFTPEQKPIIIAGMKDFIAISGNMPKDGSNKPIALTALRPASAKKFQASAATIWGMSFEDGDWKHHSGPDAMKHFGLLINEKTDSFSLLSGSLQVEDIWTDSLYSWAGDIWSWLKSAYESVKKFFIKLVDDVYHCFIEIGGQLYRFILNCINDVIQGIEFIFNKIKVFMEDLIKWIGFIFEWSDILRSHDVLKNVIKQYVLHSITQGGNYKTAISTTFGSITAKINEWAGLENFPSRETFSERSASTAPLPDQHSPQSNYGSTHLKNGLASAQANSTHSPAINDKLKSLAAALQNALKEQDSILEDAYQQLMSLVNNFENLSLGDIIKGLLGILGSLLTKSVSNVIGAAIDVVLTIVEGMWNVFEAKLNIPVLTPLYFQITGADLSLLDVVCLVLAIPATITYKLIRNEAPFPDNHNTDILKNGSWDEMRALFGAGLRRQSYGTISEATSVDPVKHGLILFLQYTAAFSCGFFAAVSAWKAYTENLPISVRAVNVIQATLFYCSTAPGMAASLISNNQQPWNVVLGEVLYGITVIQKFADIFIDDDGFKNLWEGPTKKLDCLLGIASMLTITGDYSIKDAKDIQKAPRVYVSCFANASWNLNRICTPWVDVKTGPGDFVFKAKIVCILLSGVGHLCLALFEGVAPVHTGALSKTSLA